MKRKSLAVLLVALVLMLSASFTAYAADATVSQVDGSQSTTFTGTIKVTQLKVTVPTAVSFDIDPSIEATTTVAQITAPNNITITNSSAVPVWVRVSGIAVAAVKGGHTPVLTSTSAEVSSTDYKMMFALKKEAPENFDTADDWITDDGLKAKNYYLNTDATTAANSGKIDVSGTLTMKVCGQTQKGWVSGDQFTITPTFTVSVAQPSEPSAA